MRWREGRRSDNVEDYRGSPMGGAGVKIGLGTIVVVLLGWAFGIDPRVMLGLVSTVENAQVQTPPPPEPGVRHTGSPEDEVAEFASVVLADTEDTWTALFAEHGAQYVPPKLALFTEVAQTGLWTCGRECRPFLLPT